MALPVREALVTKNASGRLRACPRAALLKLLLSAALLIGLAPSAGAQTPADADAASSAIAGNPGAVDIVAGTGALGRLLGLDPETGLRLGGVLVSNGNYLISGGSAPGRPSFNNLLVADLNADLDKLAQIPGASFGTALLRFDGQPTNRQAGVVTGYNGLTGAPPLDRTELYELWWRQSLFSDQLVVRIGKTVPTYDFGNVVRPVPVQDPLLRIPAVSGLLYTPVFVNPTILGALPGYYNSAYGVTATVAPSRRFYLSLGGYDGNGRAVSRPGCKSGRRSTATGSRSGRRGPPGCLGQAICRAPSPSAPGTRRGRSPYRGRKVHSLRTEPTAPTLSPRSGYGAAAARAMREAYRASCNWASTIRGR